MLPTKLNRAMEPRTHSKNWASSKSYTSRKNIQKIVFFFCFIFSSISLFGQLELYGLSASDLRPKAERGDASAQYELGRCYFFSVGVTKNLTQAEYWWRKSAEQGYVKAQVMLGSYYNGAFTDGQINYNQSIYWYRKAAEQGDAEGQYGLGFCYHRGLGVSKDYEQAVYWYRKAAKQGFIREYDMNDAEKKYAEQQNQRKSQSYSSNSSSSSSSNSSSSNSQYVNKTDNTYEITKLLNRIMNNPNQKYTDGSLYKGQIKNGKRDGWGIYKFTNGDWYLGQWYNNETNGKGLYLDMTNKFFYSGYYSGSNISSLIKYNRYGEQVYAYSTNQQRKFLYMNEDDFYVMVEDKTSDGLGLMVDDRGKIAFGKAGTPAQGILEGIYFEMGENGWYTFRKNNYGK